MAVSTLTGMAVIAEPVVTQMSDWLASERCDSGACGAQAWVKVQTMLGKGLQFCAHHFTGLEPALLGQGATILADGRQFINATCGVDD